MIGVALYLTILGSIGLLTWLALRTWPSPERSVLDGGTTRKHALDGARGILATSVMIRHLLPAPLIGLPLKDDGPLRVHPFVSQLGSAASADGGKRHRHRRAGRRGRLDDVPHEREAARQAAS